MIVLKVNSSSIRDRLKKEAGLKLCACCEFEDAVWLNLGSDPEKVHGVGYSCEEMGLFKVEDVLADFEKQCTYTDCGYDVEKFIKLCKEQINKS